MQPAVHSRQGREIKGVFLPFLLRPVMKTMTMEGVRRQSTSSWVIGDQSNVEGRENEGKEE